MEHVCVSLVPYPAHVARPARPQEDLLVDAMRVALRHACVSSCPLWALPGLEVALGVRVGPQCPVAVAQAVTGSRP